METAKAHHSHGRAAHVGWDLFLPKEVLAKGVCRLLSRRRPGTDHICPGQGPGPAAYRGSEMVRSGDEGGPQLRRDSAVGCVQWRPGSGLGVFDGDRLSIRTWEPIRVLSPFGTLQLTCSVRERSHGFSRAVSSRRPLSPTASGSIRLLPSTGAASVKTDSWPKEGLRLLSIR